MTNTPRITLVTEAYNLAEGQSEASFLRALGAVSKIAAQRRDVEVIVLDPSAHHLAKPILAEHFPHFMPLTVPGLTYDGQKNLAAQRASGEVMVFLDGDCAPARDTWLDEITAPFQYAHVHAVGGLTLYEDFSITGKAMSVLDFGFLFEAPIGKPMGCYASNNVAFRRSTLLDLPIPDDGLLRCYCFKHAQLMLRAKVPILSNPRALVLHELPDIQTERLRRGYDYIAALWSDPALRLTAELENSPAFALKVLEENYALAVRRMLQAPAELGVTVADHPHLAVAFRELIAIDARGVDEALVQGALDGSHARARQIHHALKLEKAAPQTVPVHRAD